MTHRERFIKTLKCEPIGGQVPTFELVFFSYNGKIREGTSFPSFL